MPLRIERRKPGGNYYLRGTVAGLHVRESLGTSDRRTADAIRIRRESELLERAALGRRAPITFAAAALAYMDAGGETRFLAPILDHFGRDTLLQDVNAAAINAAALAIYPDAAPSTINRQLITPISAVENLAAEDEGRAARRFRRRAVDDARLRWLTPKEADDLIEAAAPRIAPLIAFLIGSGVRTGEALALQRADLHLDDRQAWIAKTKTGRPRMVRFPDRVARLLAASGLPDAGAVFRTPKGQAYKLRVSGGAQIQAAFADARDAAGLGPDVTPHVLRHTWATWYDAATGDFGALLDLGGWAKSDTARRYRKIAPDSLPADLRARGWIFGAERAAARTDDAREPAQGEARPRRA